jgi:hypothetical protein
MTVRAVKTIEKDEEILASYDDSDVSVQIRGLQRDVVYLC